jgi:hypothetical protein
MAIPQELVDRMMVECGRRCCLCRRFKPTYLQVHHIDERAAGGGDEWDNLISLCISCHTDVHSKVPFTRRFTHAELKGHRASLFAMVATGQFDPNEADDYKPSILAARVIDGGGLSKEAIVLLLNAAAGKTFSQGAIYVNKYLRGTEYSAGNSKTLNPPEDNRRISEFKRGLEQLVDRGLANCESELAAIAASGQAT